MAPSTPSIRSFSFRVTMVPVERPGSDIASLLETDLATLYGIEVRAPNQAVKSNFDLFPPDSMFELVQEEAAALRSQSVTSNTKGGSVDEFLAAVQSWRTDDLAAWPRPVCLFRRRLWFP